MRLQLGDIDGYRDVCARMLEQFAGSSEFVIAHRLARACVLAPDAVADAARLTLVGDRVATLAPESRNFQEIAAATYFRAGRYEKALATLNRAARMKSNPDGDAYGNLFRALTHDRLGHPADARRWLDLALLSGDREIPDRPDASGLNRGPNWDVRLIVPILRREADAQIKERRPLYLPANVFQEDPGKARPSSLRD